VAGRDLGPLPDVPASGVALGNETGATIVIDRQLITLRRATMTVDYVEDRGGESRRVAKRWERHVTKIGDVEAHRPGSVGSPSLPARLWDVVYYCEPASRGAGVASADPDFDTPRVATGRRWRVRSGRVDTRRHSPTCPRTTPATS
jgi:hypothetical protein